MNIDQRLDRLTERHEALTQTVEILSHEINDLKGIAATTLDSIQRLERIAYAHQAGIEDLDSRVQKLEEGGRG